MNKHKIKIFLIVFLILSSINLVFSQVHQDWTARYYNINRAGGFRYIANDNEGNIIVAGGIIFNGNGDYFIMKYNALGVMQWNTSYNGTANNSDAVFGLAVDKLNNIYVTGWSIGAGTNFDYATVKYNSSGVQQWVARYNGPANGSDKANSIAVDSLGYVYVTGQSLSDLNNYGADIVTLKYYPDGVLEWENRFSGTKHLSGDWGSAITLDKYNNVYVTGSCVDSIDEQCIATIKYSPDGIEQWSAKYNGAVNGYEEGHYVKVDEIGNVYTTGFCEGSMQYEDFAVVKYDSKGIEQWSRKYDGSAHFRDIVRGMEIDNIGNVYVMGISTEAGEGYDYTTIKYNTNGNIIWISKYNNGSNDIPSAMTKDNSANIYITGSSNGTGTGQDYNTVKYDSSGILKWVMKYSSGGDSSDISQAIAIDNSENIYVTGILGLDYFTIKYSQTITGVSPVFTNIPNKINLAQNYPNPFNPVTNINYSLPNNKFVTLKVFDNLGNEVNRLINERKNAGTYSVQFNGNDLPSGIYFYSLFLDGKVTDTKRMVLLK